FAGGSAAPTIASPSSRCFTRARDAFWSAGDFVGGGVRFCIVSRGRFDNHVTASKSLFVLSREAGGSRANSAIG
ncbi:MAG: hypothetical protein JWQ17_3639, partial [Tardiphaga sp.]|nr:hypothetical protein [Tardiphaga sp.]